MSAGKILLTISLHGKLLDPLMNNHLLEANSEVNIGEAQEGFHVSSPNRKIPEGKHIIKSIARGLEKLFHKNGEASKSDDSPELSSIESEYEDCVDNFSNCSFEEALEMMQSKGSEQEMPENLRGGVLIDQAYAVSSRDLNAFLFAPNSQFVSDLTQLQGITNMQEGPWSWNSGDMSCLTRVLSYTKAGTKMMKAVRATEEQTYVKADGKEYAVFVSVSTPEVPYGNSFKVELLYKIMPGPELPSGEESCHLTISWGVNFLQSTMMRNLIEGGVRQGLKESFDQFATLLAQHFKMLDSTVLSEKDHVLSALQAEHKSDWELAIEYFWNISVLTTIFMVLYVLVHILISETSQVQGLEFSGLDLPDSFGELLSCGILVIQLEHVYNMVLHFVQARLQRGKCILQVCIEPVFRSRSKTPLRYCHLCEFCSRDSLILSIYFNRR